MRVIFVSIIPYSHYILIYNIDKPIKRGDIHKNLYQYDLISDILN